MHKFLLAGLGNPGTEYAGTRHNIGFDVLDFFVEKHGGQVWRSDRYAWTSQLKWKGKTLTCIKPSTFMNLSGKAVKYWLDKEGIEPAALLVILDDIALPLNKMRLRPSGSDGGHNGLKDIEAVLGTRNYPRLRFGVGNDFPKGAQARFVLSRWEHAELPLVNAKTALAAQVIELFAGAGFDAAARFCNAQDAGAAAGS